MDDKSLIQKQINGEKFTKEDVRYFCYLYPHFEDIDLSDVDLSHIHFVNKEFKRVNFNNADLSYTIFTECIFIDCQFENLKCNKTHFYNSTFAHNYFRPTIGKHSNSSIEDCIINISGEQSWYNWYF